MIALFSVFFIQPLTRLRWVPAFAGMTTGR